MVYWFIGLVGSHWLFFVLLNSSAEMCAGSLGPGCWILAIFATSSQVYGAHGCHLACLVPLLCRPGTTWDIGGHKEGPCGVQAWILSIF